MSPNAPSWLTARPIAHRGWHDASRGRIENTLGAARAALARGFAIECDVRLTSDGEAVVFHDATLDRLTESRGPIGERSLAQLRAVRFQGCAESIPTLPELLSEISGAVPLICEIKSRFDGDFRLAERAAALATSYAGPIALKSFDPEVVAHLRAQGLAAPLGIVAEANYDDPYFDELTQKQKETCAAFLHFPETRPDFLSWSVKDLPHATPFLLRELRRLPMMVWTVRSAQDQQRAGRWADQSVFEGEPGI